MPKYRSFSLALACAATLVAPAAPVAATILGEDASACLSGQPAIQVRVSGFKSPTGTVKVTLYEQERYLAKRGKLRRVVVPVQSTGPIDVCIAVPQPGRYAVTVHHDANANGKKDGNDGGGYSRNPRLSITNLRPSFTRTSFEVGSSPASVGIQLLYRRGLSIRPVNS